MSLKIRIAERLFGDYIEQRVQAAVKVVDDKWWTQIGGGGVDRREQMWADIRQDQDDSLDAWRDNPLARRVVSLVTDYVVGDGIRVTSEREEVQRWIDRFWDHPQNRIGSRLYAWCDEVTRCGELFIVVYRNPGDGMSYVRTIPASRIDKIETDPEDFEHELQYHEVVDGSVEGRFWPGRGQMEGGLFVLHYAVNRPVGATRGEGDLVPILPWLRRYKEWLEDRVRVNRLRNSFLWHCKLTNATPDDLARKRVQYSQPPSPGSVIVSDDNETWEALTAALQSSDAEADGKALRLMVAAGAGIPLHFLSEGESATRATATEMGGPTFRHYKRRQLWFAEVLVDLVTVCIRNAGCSLPADLRLSCVLPDLTREDNLQLAQAMKEAIEALILFSEKGWLDDESAKRLALKFAGEVE